MTGCEFDLVVNLKNKINSTVSEKEIINNEAKSIASQTGLAVDFVENRLLSLFQEAEQSNKTISSRNIRDFFKIGDTYNVKAYSDVRREVRRKIISAVLNGEDILVRTNKDMNVVLSALQRRSLRGLNLKGSAVSPLAFYINISKDEETFSKALNNTSVIANYLISSHLPTIVES